jgi:hypothetical protein
MSRDGDVPPVDACAMAGSLIAIALTLNAVASGRCGVEGSDADASTL